MMRRAKAAGGEARAKGLLFRERENDGELGEPDDSKAAVQDDDDDDEKDGEADESTLLARANPEDADLLDPRGKDGEFTQAEKAVRMLLSGFDPRSCPYLEDNLKKILQRLTEKSLEVRCDASCERSAC